MARLAVAALLVWAVLDVLRTIVAVGHYEHRIEVVVHGNTDPVLPALMVYELLDHLLPRGMTTTVADRSWIVGLLVAAAAFIIWLHRARRNAERLGGAPVWAPGWAVGGWFVPAANLVIPYLVVRDVQRAGGHGAHPAPVGRWWASVLLAVLLDGLIRLYGVVTSDGGVFEKTALDMRIVAYPLWTAGTVTVVVAAFLAARVVRRITQAQQRTAATQGPPPQR
ncbi:DUF4328 domain-containing protein [Catellatospora sichuanensis]|uniref:DUF4328 domain-containing protein n=1 Tax=Catellatospora sichuanensis TaxID=1969805 RepID=UPI0011831C46|nr:DUF4328 domain-containing protein [Catellatospora sichuanensis]